MRIVAMELGNDSVTTFALSSIVTFDLEASRWIIKLTITPRILF